MKQKGPVVIEQRNSLLSYIIPPTILATLAAIVYSPSLHYAFQFDDVANITKYFDIRANNFSALFFTGTRWISYWLNAFYYSISKFDPFMYRLGNVTFHTITGILLFFFFRYALSKLKKESFFKQNSLSIAFFTALLFLLHPVQTQTVSYVIQGQLEGLATLFITAMALCFVIRAHTKSSITRFACTTLLFVFAALSCGTKEIAIISPLLLLLVDWFFCAQGDWKPLKQRLMLHSILAIFIIGIYLYFLKPAFFINILGMNMVAKNNMGNVITAHQTDKITPLHFFISQFKVILHYLWMFIWPFNISVEYDWVMVRHFLAPDCIVPLTILLGLAFTIFKVLQANKASIIGFGALWFAFCIAPRSSFIPSPELLVDYKTYMASSGWLFLIACACIYGIQRLFAFAKTVPASLHSSVGQCAIIILLALPIGAATIARNTIWRSGTEFWGNMIKNAPGKARAYNNYGVELSQNLRKFDESIEYFKKAISMDKVYPDPWNNLAVAYAATGKIDLAIEALKQGIRINPYYPEAYNNLASFFLSNKKDYVQAEQILKTALQLRPYYGKAFFNLGRVYLEQNKNEQAWECFKNACMKGDFDNEIGFSTYGKVSMAIKKFDDAIFAYKKTLELNPAFPDAAFNLANAYFLTKKYDLAVVVYEELIKKDPNAVQACYNLGETYFVLTKFDKALACFKKIEHIKDNFPYVYIRIAGCLEKLGKGLEARGLLEEFVKNSASKEDPTTKQIRTVAQTMLGQMGGKVMA